MEIVHDKHPRPPGQLVEYRGRDLVGRTALDQKLAGPAAELHGLVLGHAVAAEHDHAGQRTLRDVVILFALATVLSTALGGVAALRGS